eukprot:Skav212769  [mRNA]  locus=scaffold159:49755:50621:- [translate_table: standard]
MQLTQDAVEGQERQQWSGRSSIRRTSSQRHRRVPAGVADELAALKKDATGAMGMSSMMLMKQKPVPLKVVALAKAAANGNVDAEVDNEGDDQGSKNHRAAAQ